VVVLSNNDGCVIARSNEAKAIGIQMGIPVFKIQDMIKARGVHVYSSNYALYENLGTLPILMVFLCCLFQDMIYMNHADKCFIAFRKKQN